MKKRKNSYRTFFDIRHCNHVGAELKRRCEKQVMLVGEYRERTNDELEEKRKIFLILWNCDCNY